MKNTGKSWEAKILAECQRLIDERKGYVFKVAVDHVIIRSTGPSRFEVQYKETPFDFTGHVGGHPVAFEAKTGTGPLRLLGKGKKGAGLAHHQRNHLAMFTATGGSGFVYYLDETDGERYLFFVGPKGDLGQGKRKSVPPSEGFKVLPGETFYEAYFRLGDGGMYHE